MVHRQNHKPPPEAIESFECSDTQRLFDDEVIGRFRTIERAARRKLLLLASAESLNDLRVLPGNQLEPLKDGRKGMYSIRINERWRICFSWRKGDVFDERIVDEPL